MIKGWGSLKKRWKVFLSSWEFQGLPRCRGKGGRLPEPFGSHFKWLLVPRESLGRLWSLWRSRRWQAHLLLWPIGKEVENVGWRSQLQVTRFWRGAQFCNRKKRLGKILCVCVQSSQVIHVVADLLHENHILCEVYVIYWYWSNYAFDLKQLLSQEFYLTTNYFRYFLYTFLCFFNLISQDKKILIVFCLYSFQHSLKLFLSRHDVVNTFF